MKLVKILVIVFCCFWFSTTSSYAAEVCINSLPKDSYSFGGAMATNDKYLFVGDPVANYVAVYTRNRDGKWIRTREILPPKDSTAYKVGSGFGKILALDGNDLIIVTFTILKPENYGLVNQQDFEEYDGFFPVATAVYQTKIDRENEVERIDLSNLKTEGVINSIEADNGKLTLLISRQLDNKRFNQVYLISEGKFHALPSEDLEYQKPSRAWRASIYGSNAVLKNNWLLVSVDQGQRKGGIWLFDLNSPQSKPQKLTIPLIEPAIFSIAISQEFIAVSNTVTSSYPFQANVSDTTLIKNIATDSTKIIAGAGALSLDNNILTRNRPVPGGGDYQTINDIPRIIEVFRLDDDATPRLIKKRKDIQRAFMQNGLLITVRETDAGRKICTENID